MKLLITFIIFSTCLHADEGLFYIRKSYEPVPKSTEVKVSETKIEFRIMSGIEVNEKCFKGKACRALRELVSKEKISEIKKDVEKKLVGDPASQICLRHNGKNIILTSEDNKEFDFCELNDGSMFNSWQFYYSKYPNKKVME